ncbi:uncharacterized protein K460DRAFT_388516 [Cucurbitaria berberidis CBS 394.84]|uniref:Uncharacterized protein n=1 Tax=Cucurbitaria berberidis CBS 394.84 TaxID=1168544 RepID=A0A9P4G9P4_9PLEO|nr:uncharacterized protein K460DRAFT_388516 [Cucurbitaria berberidis CBS 394.84]KAF1841622.1 hypothetical protein K460DRAFT_388516 [Cucurbitaria berberidis CBS 394.84]
MDIGTALSSEVTRIIECPYPASLAGLADLLARADISTIRACIHSRPPCAVSKLATIVCEALPLWAYALRVLHALSHASEFRHELLLRNPGLLNALLTQANSSHQDFKDYTELCVLLLSRPLPESIPLPAAAQSFFLHVFEKAIQTPHVDTLKSVYSMLNGACRQILSHLPLDTRQQFDTELCQILYSENAARDSMLLLWCFGIVLLVEHSDSGPEPSKTTETMERQWKTSSGKKLFGSTKSSYKTITLTCLSVIWALKGSVGVSDDDAIEGIRIASRTLRFVDQHVRESWPRSSSLAGNTVQKLQPILLEALSFYATIAGLETLQSETVMQYEQCLVEATQFADPDCLGETLAMSLPAFAPRIQETCVSPPSSHELTNLVILVDELKTGVSTSEPLRTKILVALSSDTLQKKSWRFIQAGIKNEGASCRTYAVSLHAKLTSATTALLLTTALGTQIEEPALPHTLALALIKKLDQYPSVTHKCSHYLETADCPTISLFQQGSTPHTGQHLQDWRHRLRSELQSQSFYQHLETRCDTVEEPLRMEQEKSKELEQRAADDRFHLDGLEDEKLSIADENDKVTAQLEALKADFAEANERADKMLQYRDRELDELKATLSQLEEAREQQEEAHYNLNEQQEHLRNEREITSRQVEEVARLKNRESDLENRLGVAETELEVISGRLDDLQALRELKVKYDNSTEAASIKAEEERNELSGQLQSALKNNRQAKDAYDETRKDLQLLQTSIPPLKNRIQELTDRCSEQEVELDELRTVRKNVLASMGLDLATQNPLVIRSASPSREHRRRESANNTQAIVTKVTKDMANTTFASSDPYSSQSGGSHHKRPKPRPSFKVPAMHTPYTQKPALISRPASTKPSPRKRSALGQMSPNRRHTTVGFAISDNEDEHQSTNSHLMKKRRGSLQDMEQADFDMNDVPAGTPLTPGNFTAGTGRVSDEDYGSMTDL